MEAKAREIQMNNLAQILLWRVEKPNKRNVEFFALFSDQDWIPSWKIFCS